MINIGIQLQYMYAGQWKRQRGDVEFPLGLVFRLAPFRDPHAIYKVTFKVQCKGK